MDITDYEAAVLGAAPPTDNAGDYLVLNLDNCSFGYCRLGESGSTELLHAESFDTDLWALCLDSIEALAGPGAEQTVAAQLEEANDAYRDYILSVRGADGTAFSFPGGTVTCSELEGALSGVARQIGTLFEAVGTVPGMTAYETRFVIVIGRAMRLFPVEYLVRERLSPEPLLPDSRIIVRNPENPSDDIIERGRRQAHALYRSRLVPSDYTLRLCQGGGETETDVLSLKKGQERSEIAALAFAGPVLVSGSDRLTVRKDGEDIAIALPFPLVPEETELVDLRFGDAPDSCPPGPDAPLPVMLLQIRRSRDPEKVFSVPCK